MPRPKRSCEAGEVYHLINRGNKKARVFIEVTDYQEFVTAMADAAERTGVRHMTFCIMPNHFHIVAQSSAENDISSYMQRLMNAHIRNYQDRHGTKGTGHIYQGRYRPIQVVTDQQFLNVCRYVDANPLRAGLVDRAEHWLWGGLALKKSRDGRRLLSPWPVEKPADWLDRVNRQQCEALLNEIRKAIARRRPLDGTDFLQL
jgi:putative transposase